METNTESSDKTPSNRLWSRCLKRIGWVLLMVALLAAVRLIWNRGTRASKLQEMLAELDRTEPGWRLEDIEAAREYVPEDENSALVVVAAARLLPPRWPPEEFSALFRHLAPCEKLTDESFDRLTKELAGLRSALDVAGKLADMTRGRHRIHYERNPIAISLPDQQENRRLVGLLVFEAMRQNQKGETKNALLSCRAALNAARSLGDEAIFISQLIRSAGVVYGCLAIERTLAQGEPPPDDMAALQKLLESEDALPVLFLATRGERAVLHKAFEGVENGVVSLEELRQSRAGWLESTFVSMSRMDTRQDNALFLSLMSRRLAEVQRPLHEQAALEKRFDREIRELPKTAVITRLLIPSLPKLGEAYRRKYAWLRCTIVALAIERHRREYNAWPKTIDILCPKYLSAVPLDPLDGRPLRYRRVEDGVIIYSVGQDGVDNAGNLDRDNPIRPGTDIGFRLWDVAKRRQPPRPKVPEVDPKR